MRHSIDLLSHLGTRVPGRSVNLLCSGRSVHGPIMAAGHDGAPCFPLPLKQAYSARNSWPSLQKHLQHRPEGHRLAFSEHRHPQEAALKIWWPLCDLAGAVGHAIRQDERPRLRCLCVATVRRSVSITKVHVNGPPRSSKLVNCGVVSSLESILFERNLQAQTRMHICMTLRLGQSW